MKNLPAFRQALEVLNRSSLSGNGASFMETVVQLLGERDVLLAVAKKVLAEEDRGFTLKPETADALRSVIANAEGR